MDFGIARWYQAGLFQSLIVGMLWLISFFINGNRDEDKASIDTSQRLKGIVLLYYYTYLSCWELHKRSMPQQLATNGRFLRGYVQDCFLAGCNFSSFLQENFWMCLFPVLWLCWMWWDRWFGLDKLCVFFPFPSADWQCHFGVNLASKTVFVSGHFGLVSKMCLFCFCSSFRQKLSLTLWDVLRLNNVQWFITSERLSHWKYAWVEFGATVPEAFSDKSNKITALKGFSVGLH